MAHLRTELGAAAALLVVACGGGGGSPSEPLVVVSIQYVDGTGERVHEIEGGKIPRNARVEIKFNQPVDPATARDPGIHVAPGPNSGAELGMFKVGGAKVVFDPTFVGNAVPRPLGLKAETTYLVSLPTAAMNGLPVRDVNGNALAIAHSTTFTTGQGYILETVRPRFLGATFSSGTSAEPAVPDSVVGAHVSVTFRFSEAMDPSSMGFSVSTPKAKEGEGFDVRYLAGKPANAAAGLEGVPVLGTATVAPSLDAVTFYPANSFGDGPYVFSMSVLWGLRDLAGNTLENPTVLGPFTCDASGSSVPSVLGESFLDAADRDDARTTSEWNGTHPGVARGPALTARRVRVTAAGLLSNGTFSGPGQYVAMIDPFVGTALNAAVGGITPLTSLGRRVMWSFDDDELGASGAVTNIGWGPDSNATFAATYPEVLLRLGQKATPSLALAATFSGNYATEPTVVYDGPYVVPQRANVGNETTPFTLPAAAGYPALAPLFANTGYQSWPSLSSYFEWDAGTSASGDSAMVFDASVAEGDTWQQARGWFGLNLVAPVGAVVSANRRLYSTFGADSADPPNGAGVLNPEPGTADVAFTFVTRTSIAQSRFYTPGPSDPAGNAYPGPDSAAHTFGTKSDYAPAVISPSVQPGVATVHVEYQGAMALDASSDRRLPDVSQAVTPWTTDVDACDGYPYIRWRLTLVADVLRNEVPEVDSVAIPVRRLP